MAPKLKKELEVKGRETENIPDHEYSPGNREDPEARKNQSPKAAKRCLELCMPQRGSKIDKGVATQCRVSDGATG